MTRALFASMIATAVISALIYLNVRMALFPSFDLLHDIALFNDRIGLPATSQAVWVTHVMVGVFVFGAIFAVLQPILPGRGTVQGMWFGFVLWLIMMVSFMPLAQHEIFARDLWPAFPVLALVLHLLYGGVLGMSHAALSEGDE